MPDCFWTGFINSREPGCSGDAPPPDLCVGVPPPPASIDMAGELSGNSVEACGEEALWFPVFGEVPAGYVFLPVSGVCAPVSGPANVTLVRECDAQVFIVPVGNAEIVCC